MKRYIKQITRDNFLYPNNDKSYYDNEIIHSINDGFPTGTIDLITINQFNSSTLDFTVEWEYFRNGCELFKNIDNSYTYITFHLLAPDQIYYKPWRYVGRFNDITPYTGTSIESDTQIIVSPSDLGLTGFTNGEYQLEVRFIGKRAIYPVCVTFNTFDFDVDVQSCQDSGGYVIAQNFRGGVGDYPDYDATTTYYATEAEALNGTFSLLVAGYRNYTGITDGTWWIAGRETLNPANVKAKQFTTDCMNYYLVDVLECNCTLAGQGYNLKTYLNLTIDKYYNLNNDFYFKVISIGGDGSDYTFTGSSVGYSTCEELPGCPTPTPTPTITPTITLTPTPTPTITPTPSSTLAKVVIQNVDSDMEISSISVGGVDITGVSYPVTSGNTVTGYTSNVGGNYNVIVNISTGTTAQSITVVDSNSVSTCINYTGGIGHTFTNQYVNITQGITITIENSICN